jgi:hypothetical protein
MFTNSPFNPTHQKSALYLGKQKSWKNSAKCAHCSGVRSDLTVPLKLPAQKKLKISENKENVHKYPHYLTFLSIKKDLKRAKTLNTLKTLTKTFDFFGVCALHGKKIFL